MPGWRGPGRMPSTEIRKAAANAHRLVIVRIDRTCLEVIKMIGHEQDEVCVPQRAIEHSVLAAARQQAIDKLLCANSNIVGVGIGKRVKGPHTRSDDCVRVYVVKKHDKDRLSPASMVPRKVGVVPTDVIAIERFGRRGDPARMTPKTTTNTTARAGARIRVRTNAPNVNEGARGTV